MIYHFNGAAARKPRKLDARGTPDRVRVTSMGPWLASRGNPATVSAGFPGLQWGRVLTNAESRGCRPSSRLDGRFNGAAFLRTRNLLTLSAMIELDHWLQWGRVLTNAESQPHGPERPREGPLQWGRVLTNAESKSSTTPTRSKPSLQWGRVLTNAESPLRGLEAGGPTLLQWGRVLTNAESVRQQTLRVRDEVASMGPRSYERGIGIYCADSCRPHGASMGPRSYERGIRGVVVTQPACVGASMGPRSYERGIGHGPGRSDLIGLASMGPRSYERGIRGVVVTQPACVGASMGPRSYERGIGHGPGRSDLIGLASMGPRSYERGIRAAQQGLGVRRTLQWGRVLTNAESRIRTAGRLQETLASMGPRSYERGIAGRPGGPHPRPWASMGPRSYERGILSAQATSITTHFELQWGRVLTNAESLGKQRSLASDDRFNGAAFLRTRNPPLRESQK